MAAMPIGYAVFADIFIRTLLARAQRKLGTYRAGVKTQRKLELWRLWLGQNLSQFRCDIAWTKPREVWKRRRTKYDVGRTSVGVTRVAAEGIECVREVLQEASASIAK